MSGGVTQVVILLLGAFTLMLLITLASEPWKYPDRTHILSLIVAFAALIGTCLNSFFTFFWHPEDLRIYIRSPDAKPLQDKPDTVDIKYFFSNMGNQAVLIDDVSMSEIWVHSATPNNGLAGLDRCNSQAYSGQVASLLGTPELLPMQDGSRFRLVRPTKIYGDGAESKSSAAAIEAGKMKVISATFETDTAPGPEYNMLIICPVINFFDSKGQPVIAVCKGWVSSHPGSPSLPRTLFWPPSSLDMPARLLPPAIAGPCNIDRTTKTISFRWDP
jgi:hypothetical protein